MCDLSDPRITQTYQAIIEGEPTDWLLLGYNDTRDVISLYSKGTEGLNEFRSQLKEEILFGFVRVEDRFILISYVPDQVSGVRRARTLVHSRSVASLFQVHHAQLTAASLNDLSDANIRTRLKLGENQVPNRSRPSSLSERKRSSLQARRKSQQQPPSDRPSLPSSPTTSSYTAEPDTFEEAQEEFAPALDTTSSTPTPVSLSSATPTSTSTLDANDYHDQDDPQLAGHDHNDEQQRLEEEQQRLEEQQRFEEHQRLAEQQRLVEQQRMDEQRRLEEEQYLEQQRQAEQRAAEQRQAEKQRVAQEEEEKKQRQKQEAERLAKEKEELRRQQIEKDRLEKQRLLQKQLQQAEKTKDVIIQGFSNIQPSGSPFWRRRFFAVRGKNLAFYRDHDSITPITIIDLKSIRNLRWADLEVDTFVPNAFTIETSDEESYQIFADHKEDATTIFTALETIIQSK